MISDDSNINGESQLPLNKTESANNQTVTAGVGETADSQKQAGVFPLYVAAIICFIIGVLCGFLFIYLRKRFCLRKEKENVDEEESSSLNEVSICGCHISISTINYFIIYESEKLKTASDVWLQNDTLF